MYAKGLHVTHSILGNTNQTHEAPPPSEERAVLKRRGKTQVLVKVWRTETPGGDASEFSLRAIKYGVSSNH